jgi:hypothetical protein
MLDEVDNEDNDDFANFNDDKDNPGISEEQWALHASFETTPRPIS